MVKLEVYNFFFPRWPNWCIDRKVSPVGSVFDNPVCWRAVTRPQNFLSPSISRLSNVVPSLINLPTELRQQILRLVLPDTNGKDSPWPTQTTSLWFGNRRLLLDMGPVIDIWSLSHCNSFPSSISNTKSQALKLKVRTHTKSRMHLSCLIS